MRRSLINWKHGGAGHKRGIPVVLSVKQKQFTEDVNKIKERLTEIEKQKKNSFINKS
jgi:hypothetical protein